MRAQYWDLLPDLRISPVGHVPEGAVETSQPGCSQCDPLDHSRSLADVYDVAHAVLILDQNK